MTRKNFIILGVVLTAVFLYSYGMKVKAFEKQTQLNAVGDFTMDTDGSGVAGDCPSDVVIAAEDMYYLYELCK